MRSRITDGGPLGVGHREGRRDFSTSELCDILHSRITEHTREADRYDTLGQAEAAERLLRQACTLAAYPT
jgi:hypothetical protein